MKSKLQNWFGKRSKTLQRKVSSTYLPFYLQASLMSETFLPIWSQAWNDNPKKHEPRKMLQNVPQDVSILLAGRLQFQQSLLGSLEKDSFCFSKPTANWEIHETRFVWGHAWKWKAFAEMYWKLNQHDWTTSSQLLGAFGDCATPTGFVTPTKYSSQENLIYTYNKNKNLAPLKVHYPKPGYDTAEQF